MCAVLTKHLRVEMVKTSQLLFFKNDVYLRPKKSQLAIEAVVSVIGMFAPSTGNLNNVTLDHMKMYMAVAGDTNHFSYTGGYPGIGNRPVQSLHTGVPFSRKSASQLHKGRVFPTN